MSPTPATYQNVGMTEYDGRAPGLDASGFIADMAYKVKIKAKTASYTINANESGTVFTTRGAGAAVIFTLPAVASGAGCLFRFFNCVDYDMTIASAEGTNMMTKHNTAASSVAFSTTSEKIGASCKVIGDGTSWLVFVTSEELQTMTVA